MIYVYCQMGWAAMTDEGSRSEGGRPTLGAAGIGELLAPDARLDPLRAVRIPFPDLAYVEPASPRDWLMHARRR